MKLWDLNKKPCLDICPEHYCFCWVPPKGSADLSGKSYNSFEGAVAAAKTGVIFLHGGCAAPLGPCKRGSKSESDKDCYEPFNSCLRKANLPELFFCDPKNLDERDLQNYEAMVKQLWNNK